MKQRGNNVWQKMSGTAKLKVDHPLSMNDQKGLRTSSQKLNVRVVCGFLLILTLYYSNVFGYSNHSSYATEAAAAATAARTSMDPGSSSVAFQQSFGLFHDISNAAWEKLRKKTLVASWYANPNDPLDKIDDAPWWIAHNMNPTFDCPHLEKVGGKGHEGTKFLCNPGRLVHEGKEDCLIYSVGCAGDFKFEDAMSEMYDNACEIHIFDPADWTRKNDAKLKNIHYHAWGLASTYDTSSKSIVWPKGRGGGFKTFPDTLELLGHQNRTIDIFKIDCEGCEWSSHKDWIGHGFGQIMIELHGVPNPRGDPKARWYQKPLDVSSYWKDFSDNGYALFNRDPNNALGLELSFIKLREDFWKD